LHRHPIYLVMSSLIGHNWVIILHMEEDLLLWYGVRLCVVQQFYHMLYSGMTIVHWCHIGFFFPSWYDGAVSHCSCLSTLGCFSYVPVMMLLRDRNCHATVILTTLSVCWLWRWRQKVLLKHCLSIRLHGIVPQKTNLKIYLLWPLCCIQIMTLTRIPFRSVICFPTKFRIRQ
jgi:hypothetical protein